MVVRYKFMEGLPQSALPKQDQPFQAGLFARSDEAFRVGIQIGRAWRQFHSLHSGAFQDLGEFRGEQRIPIVDQVSLPTQEAFARIAQISHHLAHPKPIRLPRHSSDLHFPTRQDR